jgi:GNAT superfamily N-acetyltransferase
MVHPQEDRVPQPTHTLLQPFQPVDLPVLVDFWNRVFADRHNFAPITPAEFQSRILACPAFDPQGLILAWRHTPDQPAALIGFVHALRPPPATAIYGRVTPAHHLAMLMVDPAHRRQGIGSRLLQAAENWLYYCPIQVGGHAQPCYGTLEGPRPPFFGSTQGMTVSVHDRDLLGFLSRRNYRVEDPGDVSLRLALASVPASAPTLPDLTSLGLRLVVVDENHPFTGHEPEGRAEYGVWPPAPDAPYVGYLLVDEQAMLHGHLYWYPMRRAGWAAIGGFWVAPACRGQGLGRALLGRALYDLAHPHAPKPEYHTVEVQTHLVLHARATALYQQHGFDMTTAWVRLVKT